MRIALLAGLAGLVIAPATSVSAQPTAAVQEGGSLRPNDVVRITVWRNPELSGEFQVGVDGHILHPIYREIQVGGIPLSEIEGRVRQFLTRFDANPQFIVEPLFSVAITGEVRQPGLYTLAAGTTMLQAIAAAGGAAESGRMNKVNLHRAGVREELNLRDSEADRNRRVVSGDQVEVTRRGPNILQTFVGPVASLLAATATIINLTR